MRSGRVRAIALVLLPWAVACTDTTSRPAAETSSGDGSSSRGAETSSSTGADTTAGESESSTSLVWPPDDGITECIRTCTGPFDCCPAGSAGSCPGPYPWNIDCIDGLCVPGQCTSDTDCPDLAPAQVCRFVAGLGTCVTPCDDDPNVCDEPNTGLACSGNTDEGESYCVQRCDAPGVFCGNQTCDPDSGRCVCEGTGQCINGWVCA